jgi:hypothetical protein
MANTQWIHGAQQIPGFLTSFSTAGENEAGARALATGVPTDKGAILMDINRGPIRGGKTHQQPAPRTLSTEEANQRRQRGRPRMHSAATEEDKRLLRKVYGRPLNSSSSAMKRVLTRHLLMRHPDWTRDVLYRLRRELGVQRHHEKWTGEEVRELLDMAGEKPISTLQKTLGRSREAIQMKLARLAGRKITKVRNGYSQHEVRQLLHIGLQRLDSLIEQEVLKLSDPAIGYSSLKEFVQKYAPRISLVITPPMRRRLLRIRKPKEQNTIALILGVGVDQVKRWVTANLLRPVDGRITADSFARYCSLHRDQLRTELMTEDEQRWFYNEFGGWQQQISRILPQVREMELIEYVSLRDVMALLSLDESAALRVMNKMGARAKSRNSLRTCGSGTAPPLLSRQKLIAFLEGVQAGQLQRAAECPATGSQAYRLKHLMKTRECACRKRIRGNGYFKHLKSCQSVAAGHQFRLTA